jgi:hypothetical protein
MAITGLADRIRNFIARKETDYKNLQISLLQIPLCASAHKDNTLDLLQVRAKNPGCINKTQVSCHSPAALVPKKIKLYSMLTEAGKCFTPVTLLRTRGFSN